MQERTYTAIHFQPRHWVWVSHSSLARGKELGWSQSRPGGCGEQKNLWPLPGIKPRFLGSLTRCLVTIQITPSRHPIDTKYISKTHLIFCFYFIPGLPKCSFPTGITSLPASLVSSVHLAFLVSAFQQYYKVAQTAANWLVKCILKYAVNSFITYWSYKNYSK
jgi:hypothetical protein